MDIAAAVIVILLFLLCIFQLALAFGAPLGQFAWGGNHKILPKNLRIGSFLSVFIYIVIALCIVSKSGILQIIPQGSFLDVLTWIIFAYFSLGIFMNAISRSKKERYTMTPLVFILALCTLTVLTT